MNSCRLHKILCTDPRLQRQGSAGVVKDPTPAGLMLGQHLRELRTKRRLTQQALAAIAGIP